MNTKLDELYKNLSATKLFEKMPECENCHMECRGRQRERWLLKEEVGRLKDLFTNVVELDGVAFFEGGPCRHLKDGKCSIYDVRPLECRISPVKLTEQDGALYWMLTQECRAVKQADPEKLNDLKKRAFAYIERVEEFFDRSVWNEISAACKAINRFDPYTDGEDCFVLGKVKDGRFANGGSGGKGGMGTSC